MANNDDDNGTSLQEKSGRLKSKPKKVLPTDRVSVARQFDLLRGYAAASGGDRRPVTNEDVAKVVNIHSGSISNCNPFFLDVGFISREKNGNVPSEDVFAFAERSQWNPDKAAVKLSTLIRKTWFCGTLLPKLAFRPLTIDQAIEFLADEASAGPEYKDQLTALIEYLKISGIISVDGNNLSLIKDGIEEEVPEKAPPDLPNSVAGTSETARSKGMTSDGSHHPFITGLLKTLPEPDSDWSIAGRVKWLQAASNIFGLIYTTKDDDIEFIEIIKKSL